MTLASPFSTGGGGETFEKLAGACILAALLAQEELPGLDLPVTKVRFQQRYAGHLLDDIVVEGASAGARRTLEIQVRHRPRLVASDPKFVELVAVLLGTMRENPTAILNGTRRLGLLVDMGTPGWKSLHELTRLAWAHDDVDGFYRAVAADGHTGKPVRDRLDHLVRAKAKADKASEIGEDPEVWVLLHGLRVLAWSLDESTGIHRSNAIGQIRRALPTTARPARAPELFAVVLTLVADLVPLAGGVTRMGVVDKLQGRGQWQFSPDPRASGVEHTPGLTGDDLVRGPLRTLGLDAEVERAERLLTTDPAEAAMIFAMIAAKLREDRFDAHADHFAGRQADALLAAGSTGDATELCLDMATRDIEHGLGSSTFLARVEPIASGLPVTEQVRIEALNALAGWHRDPSGAVTVLRPALATLMEADHPAAPRVALFLAELAAVIDDTNLIMELRSTLVTMAETAEAMPEHPDREVLGVRLRLCVAEADEDFAGLWRRANTGRDLEPAQAALVMARHGRWLAGKADPELAEDAYWRAVDHAIAAQLWGEAAEALRSVATLHMRFPFPKSDFAEPLLRARTAAREGEGRYLPRRYDPKAAALDAWHKGSMPSAHQDLTRYLWEARLCGHLAAELDARKLLGDLFVVTATPETAVIQIGMAIGQYIAAGEGEKAKTQAAEAAEPGVPVDIDLALASPVPWERASALAVVSGQADVVPEDRVEPTLRTVLAATAGLPQSPFGPQVHLEAIGALAALAERVPSGLVDEVLAIFEQLLERAAGQDRRPDRDLLRGLFGLYRAQPQERDRIGRLLLKAIELGGDLGYRTARLPFEDDLIQPLLPGLREQADRGVPEAITALALAEEHHPAVLEEAEQRAARILEEEPRPWSGGDFRLALRGQPRAEAACFALQLPEPKMELVARHLLRLAAEGTGDVDPGRADALDGIALLGPHLSDSTRDELVEPVLALAQANADSPVDQLWQGTLHPLSPGKINLGHRRAAAAVHAAALLARRPEHGRAVLAAVRMLTLQNDSSIEQAAARSIWRLMDDGLVILEAAQVLEIGKAVPFRVLAVMAWCRTQNPTPELADQFAQDPARSVRRALAEALPQLNAVAPQLVQPLLDRLRRDPSAVVRQAAVQGSSKAA
jgi:HEAT repeats